MQTKSDRLTDYRITSAEVYGAPCRCRGYQGKSALALIEIDTPSLASQEVTTYHGKFPKPVGLYAVLAIFGKKHRGVGRRRVEEAQKDRRAGILRGETRALPVALV